MILEWAKKHIDAITCVIFAGYGLFIRCMTLQNRKFWDDEILQFHSIARSLKPFWFHQNYVDHTSFPGEYLLNYFFVRWFGMNKWGLAIPHIIITIVGFWLLYKVCRFFFRSWPGYVAAFTLFTFNTNLIFHSFEFRAYAVLPVLALMSLLLCESFFSHGQAWSSTKTVAAGILIILTVNYHAYGIIIFTLPLFFVVVRRLVSCKNLSDCKVALGLRDRSIRNFVIFCFFIVVALLCWGWYASFNRWGLKPNAEGQYFAETFAFIANPAQDPLPFLRGVVGNLILMPSKARYLLLFSIPLAFILPNNRKLEQFLFLCILVILPILLILYSDIKSHYWFLQRQFIWVMPLFAIFLGWQWDSVYLWAKKQFSKVVK